MDNTQESYRWFVLYVRANTEKRVIDDFKLFADRKGFSDEASAFCPESEYYYRNRAERKKGECYRKRPLFPSYVFVESKLTAREFLRDFGAYIYGSLCPEICKTS